MKTILENIRARFAAVPYNIYTQKIDPNLKPHWFFGGDWYANGKLWYGRRWGVFFESFQNIWFQDLNK